MPVCDHDCFHCKFPDCILDEADETPEEIRAAEARTATPPQRSQREKYKKYYAANRERILQRQRERYRADIEASRQYHNAWAKNHPDAAQRWARKHREVLNARNRERYANDPEYRERCKRYRKEAYKRKVERAKHDNDPKNN